MVDFFFVKAQYLTLIYIWSGKMIEIITCQIDIKHLSRYYLLLI